MLTFLRRLFGRRPVPAPAGPVVIVHCPGNSAWEVGLWMVFEETIGGRRHLEDCASLEAAQRAYPGARVVGTRDEEGGSP